MKRLINEQHYPPCLNKEPGYRNSNFIIKKKKNDMMKSYFYLQIGIHNAKSQQQRATKMEKRKKVF